MPLAGDQLTAAARLFARAMENDPLNRYFIPDDQKRRRALELLYSTLIALEPHALVTEGDDMPCAAIVERHGVNAGLPRIWDMLRYGFSLAACAGLSAIMRMVRYQAFALKLHHKVMTLPHDYVMLLSTDPEHQKQGHAGRLLDKIWIEAGRKGVPVFLETQKEENAAYYQKHGFTMLAETHVPGTDVKHWLLERPVNPR